MAKRFTETTKWGKEWFQALTPKLKCLWFYLVDNCDPAGVWEPNLPLASFQIGEEVLESDLDFGGRVSRLPNGKIWIQDFVQFQYGQLSDQCKAHIPVLKALKRHSLISEDSKGYAYPLHTLKEKEKEKEKEEVITSVKSLKKIEGKKMDKDGAGFEEHLLAWWGKDGRVGYMILQEFVDLAKKHGWPKVYDAVQSAAQYNKKSFAYVRAIVDPTAKKQDDPWAKFVNGEEAA